MRAIYLFHTYVRRITDLIDDIRAPLMNQINEVIEKQISPIISQYLTPASTEKAISYAKRIASETFFKKTCPLLFDLIGSFPTSKPLLKDIWKTAQQLYQEETFEESAKKQYLFHCCSFYQILFFLIGFSLNIITVQFLIINNLCSRPF